MSTTRRGLSIALCCIGAACILALSVQWAQSLCFPCGEIIDEARLDFCSKYADSAVVANHSNIGNKCGFGGPRYQSDRWNHERYCLTTSVDDVKEEWAKRTKQISSCELCRDHAQEAMSQVKAANMLKCGFTKSSKPGQLFDPEEQGHFNRCYAVVFSADSDRARQARDTVVKAKNMREEMIKSCMVRPGVPDGFVKFCDKYVDGDKALGIKGVMEQVNDKCAPPDDGGRWSRRGTEHRAACIAFMRGDINVGNADEFMKSEREAREATLNACPMAIRFPLNMKPDNDGGVGQTKQPLAVAPDITDPEPPSLDVRRVPARITDPEGPSLKTTRGRQGIVPSGGSDGSKDNGQTKKKLTVRPAAPAAPKQTGGSDGSNNGCNSAMDRLGGGCIPASASGGGSTFTPRDAARPPAGGGGGAARAPVVTPAPGPTLGGGATGGAYGSNDGPGLKGGARIDGGTFKIRSGGSIVPAPAPAQEKWRGNVN